MKKNILIVEDEMIIAASTEIIIEELGHNSIGIASDLEQTKEFINDYSIDLVLLDINLGLKDVDGIEIANYLNSVHIPHIFTTSYSDKNTLEAALNQNPLGYIVKPLNMATLYTQLELAFRKIDETYIKIKDAGKTYIIPKNGVKYIHAEGNYCTIHTVETKIVIRQSLKKITDLLSNNFVQTNKAYVINSHFISTIKENEVVLSENSVIPLSRHYKENLRNKF